MNQRKPPHRTQTDAPGRKAPRKIDGPRTIRIDPDTWAYAMDYAIRSSVKKGYIVTMKEAIADIVADHQQWTIRKETDG